MQRNATARSSKPGITAQDVFRVFGPGCRIVSGNRPAKLQAHNDGDDIFREWGGDLLEVALHHHEAGRAVIAVTKAKAPYNTGWNQWFARAQTRAEVEREFSNGAHGIAILTAPAQPSFGVLDFDGPHAAEAWKATNIELPTTARNFTPSGGMHLIFKIDDSTGLSRRVRIVKAGCDCAKVCGVDFLVNGFFLVPPTPGYIEDADQPFEKFAQLPQAVLELATKKQSTRAERRRESRAGEKIKSGERNSRLTSLAGSMRRRDMSSDAIRAALLAENAERCDPPLDDKEVERIARSISKYEPRGEKDKSAVVAQGRSPLLIKVSDVQREEICWLRNGRIARRKITLIEGDPGEMKSWLTLFLAAGVTTGSGFPGDEQSEPANVVIMSAEDGAGDTIRPHLEDMGADLKRVTLLKGIVDAQGKESFLSLADLDVLESAIVQVNPALLIIDPIIAYTAKADTHKASEVRGLLFPLAALAEKYNVAVVCVMHLTKSTGKTKYRGQGSIDFLAACRSAFLCGPDPADPTRKIFCHVKSNLGALMPSLTYWVENGRLVWGAETTTTAEQILSEGVKSEEKNRLDEAKEFLESALSDGAVLSATLVEQARAVGIGGRTLWRAKADMRIKARKQFGSGAWEWSLPSLKHEPDTQKE